jgi:micrococcal nuclease
MSKWALVSLVALVLTSASAAGRSATVAYVIDGDTIALTGGPHVRLLQIDTPEVGSGECYSRRAAKDLRRLLPGGSSVGLETDPPLDTVDRYGRLLRYVFHGGVNINLALVTQGDATVWFYGHRRGRYAARLLEAARRARTEKRGIWGACRTAWDPYSPATTDPKGGTPPKHGCDASYPTVCIPSPPPDLDCSDIRYRHFKVVGRDPHHFDGDHDGVGCE